MKTCVTCKSELPDSEFHRNPRASDRLQSNCKSCCSSYSAEYRTRNVVRLREYKKLKNAQRSKEEKRSTRYLRRYGIDLQAYEKMLADQSGVCAICGGVQSGAKKRLCVDHCHATGAVRGLLCDSCNVGIGRMADSAERLFAAARYLLRTQTMTGVK